jgi:phage terminase small subunit
MKSFKQHLDEKCWDGYVRRGMKKKGKKMVPNCVPEMKEEHLNCGTNACCGRCSTAMMEGSETWEAGYKRRVVKTTDPEHKEKGMNWRIKGKDKSHLTIKLYKEKPSFKEFTKQMKRVAGHEFGG